MSINGPGDTVSGAKKEILGSDEQIKSFVGFFRNLERKGLKMENIAEDINNNDAMATRIAQVFWTKLKRDGEPHRHDRENIPTYNDALQKMQSEAPQYLIIEPREAGVFLYQLVMLMSQYGINEKEIFKTLEFEFDPLAEQVAEVIKPEEDEEKPEGLAVGEHK